jgi:hypothetical protein
MKASLRGFDVADALHALLAGAAFREAGGGVPVVIAVGESDRAAFRPSGGVT